MARAEKGSTVSFYDLDALSDWCFDLALRESAAWRKVSRTGMYHLSTEWDIVELCVTVPAEIVVMSTKFTIDGRR